jgi:hypothetical protein
VPFTNTGCEIKTPTLSKLAAEGVVLDNYYVSTSKQDLPRKSDDPIDTFITHTLSSRLLFIYLGQRDLHSDAHLFHERPL